MWRCYRDPDDFRETIRRDLAGARERGKVPLAFRLGAWGAAGAGLWLADVPILALPAILVFEAFLAPRLARRGRPELGTLRRWRPPDSFVESPESVPPSTSRWARRR
jgi:hypothetical protein